MVEFAIQKSVTFSELIVVYFMLILVSGAKMQLPLQLGVTDRQTYSTTTVTLCACALRVNKITPFLVSENVRVLLA